MGLFSFGKSNGPKAINKVWMTRNACLQGIALEVRTSQTSTVVVTVFEESHQTLLEFLEKSGISYEVISSFIGKGLQQKNLFVIKSTSLPAGLSPQKINVNLIIFGRYPFVQTEKTILERLSAGFPGSPIAFCLSLDDHVFKVFGSDRIKSLMETLGMKEEESIQHAMIDKAIANALEKVNKDLQVELSARSEKDWFARNIIPS